MILTLYLIRIMKRFLAHSIAVLFLLFLAGTKLFVPTSVVNSPSTPTSVYSTPTSKYLHEATYKVNKAVVKDYSFSNVEAENDDIQVQDTLDFAAVVSALVAYTICIHFILYAFRRRRTFYLATIQLFRYKYLVFRSLRI